MLYVVIPIYNAEKYLRAAVSSAIEQPYKDIKVVLVDDGSTDGSGVLCDELAVKSNRITALHQENAGVSTARNTGIDYVLLHASTHDYIAFLDADDGWTSGFFSKDTVQLLQSEYDLIGFQYCNCDSRLCPYDTPEDMTEGLHSGGQRSVWLHGKQSFAAMLYSCEFLKKNNIRFFGELKYSEDKIFSMQCMYLADSIYLENKLLYLYRHTGNSAMHKRQYGIPYYVPIIDGYLKLDALMRQNKSNRQPLTESRLMAGIYIMDMIDEHYCVLGSKKEVDALLISRPDYVSIVEATGEYVDLTPNPEFARYKAHPISYIVQDNLNGGVRLCKKILRKLHLLVS